MSDARADLVFCSLNLLLFSTFPLPSSSALQDMRDKTGTRRIAYFHVTSRWPCWFPVGVELLLICKRFLCSNEFA